MRLGLPGGLGLGVGLMVVLGLSAAGAAETAASVQHEIAREGAAAVVRRLAAGDGRRWEALLHHVESGQAPWLQTALALKPGADAGTAEGLTSSVATALLRNPANVLRLMVPAYDLDRLCSVPLIEPSPAQLAAYKGKAASALASVSSPELAARARQCRDEILK